MARKVSKPVIEVMYGDCRELLKGLSTHSFDACITDPPYRKLEEAVIGTQEGYGTGVPEYKEWLWEVKRVLKPNAHIVMWEHPYNLDVILQVGKDLGLVYKSIFVWHATNRSQGHNITVRPFNVFDIAVWWIKEPATKWTYNHGRRGIIDLFEHTVVHQKVKTPGAKPIDIIKPVVSLFTNEGDWIIDPFAGTGTTARACLELNRNCLTMEIRKDALSKYLQSRTLSNVRRFF